MFFLWRFLQLFRCYRGNQEFVLWIGRFEVTSRRVLLQHGWILFHHDIPEVTTIEFFNLLNPAARQQTNDIADPEEQRQRLTELRDEQINILRNAHRQHFPLTDNLMSLVFLVQADLNENQQGTFLLHRCRFDRLTWLSTLICKSSKLFMELFLYNTHWDCRSKPSVKRSTFLVIEEGEYDGETGILGSRGRNRR